MRRGGTDCRTTRKELKVYLTHLLSSALLHLIGTNVI